MADDLNDSIIWHLFKLYIQLARNNLQGERLPDFLAGKGLGCTLQLDKRFNPTIGFQTPKIPNVFDALSRSKDITLTS